MIQIKTMAAAELGNDIIHRNFDEDAYMGLLMVSSLQYSVDDSTISLPDPIIL